MEQRLTEGLSLLFRSADHAGRTGGEKHVDRQQAEEDSDGRQHHLGSNGSDCLLPLPQVIVADALLSLSH